MVSDMETAIGPSMPSSPGGAGLEASLTGLRRAIDEMAHTLLIRRLIELLLRPTRPAERPTRSRIVAFGVLATTLRLLVPVVVTTVAGAWADAPLWSWAIVAVVFAGNDVYTLASGFPHTSQFDDLFSLTGTLEREDDVRQLSRLPQRWLRVSVRVAVGVVLALPILAAAVVVSPQGLTSIHVGSAAMLVLVLYEFSEMVFFGFLVTILLLRSESRYPHRLWWLSPADTPAIPRMLHAWGNMAVGGGVSVLFYMLPVALLVAPGTAAFLVALVGAMTLSGYLVTIASYVSVRASVRTIVRHHQQRTLQRLQFRIDDFGPRLGDLTPAESGRLQGLMATYAAVRDAPLLPRSAEVGRHALTALVVPGIGFFLAVLAEVYAERLLTQLVP